MLARWALAVVLVAAAPSVARAQAVDPEPIVVHGIALRREGRDAEALDEFRRAYALKESPRTLAQIALAEQALGRWVDAEPDLVRALAAEGDPWIDKNRALHERGLAAIREQLGWLEVTADVDGASLWIDGARVASLPAPAPVRVPAGSIVIEVRAPGYATVTRTAVVGAGLHAREAIHLVPLEALASSPPPPDAPVVPPLGAIEPNARIVPANARERTIGFALVGAGVVALGVGRYFGVRKLSTKSWRVPQYIGLACYTSD